PQQVFESVSIRRRLAIFSAPVKHSPPASAALTVLARPAFISGNIRAAGKLPGKLTAGTRWPAAPAATLAAAAREMLHPPPPLFCAPDTPYPAPEGPAPEPAA